MCEQAAATLGCCVPHCSTPAGQLQAWPPGARPAPRPHLRSVVTAAVRARAAVRYASASERASLSSHSCSISTAPSACCCRAAWRCMASSCCCRAASWRRAPRRPSRSTSASACTSCAWSARASRWSTCVGCTGWAAAAAAEVLGCGAAGCAEAPLSCLRAAESPATASPLPLLSAARRSAASCSVWRSGEGDPSAAAPPLPGLAGERMPLGVDCRLAGVEASGVLPLLAIAGRLGQVIGRAGSCSRRRRSGRSCGSPTGGGRHAAASSWVRLAGRTDVTRIGHSRMAHRGQSGEQGQRCLPTVRRAPACGGTCNERRTKILAMQLTRAMRGSLSKPPVLLAIKHPAPFAGLSNHTVEHTSGRAGGVSPKRRTALGAPPGWRQAGAGSGSLQVQPLPSCSLTSHRLLTWSCCGPFTSSASLLFCSRCIRPLLARPRRPSLAARAAAASRLAALP